MAQNEAVDVVLVGAGIMSATLAVLLKELDPALKLEVVELMDPAGRRRLDRHQESRADQHSVRGLEAVLGLPEQEKQLRFGTFVHKPGAAPELCRG